jgi:hypothetical protein
MHSESGRGLDNSSTRHELGASRAGTLVGAGTLCRHELRSIGVKRLERLFVERRDGCSGALGVKDLKT